MIIEGRKRGPSDVYGVFPIHGSTACLNKATFWENLLSREKQFTSPISLLSEGRNSLNGHCVGLAFGKR